MLEFKREKQVLGESGYIWNLFKYSLSWTNTPVGYCVKLCELESELGGLNLCNLQRFAENI